MELGSRLSQSLQVVAVLSWLLLVKVTGIDFDSAVQLVRSHNVVMDIVDYEIVGSKQLMDDGLTESQKTKLESEHAQAVAAVLAGMENLARNLDPNYLYRRADGLGNNIKNPRWGSAFYTQERLLANAYIDGVGQPRTRGVYGNNLHSARTISLKCFPPSDEDVPFFDQESTQLLFQFGQFLDHEVIATSLEIAFGCCSGPRRINSSNTPCFTIPIEPEDRFFRGNCMNFRRAVGVYVNGVREQMTTDTSFVDLSPVYGSDDVEQAKLREYRAGLLKASGDNMLPLRDQFPCVKRTIQECPFAGESRVSEIAGLSVIHLIFFREHNRIAAKLAEVNPTWNDEKLFQEARKINSAQQQRIVYREFLPKVLGPDIIRIIGIDKPHVYDELVNPSVINEFGVAAFRFGHTMLSAVQYFEHGVSLPLSQLYFRPESVLYQGEAAVRAVMDNQASRFPQKFDSFFTTEITDKLYLGVDREAEQGESFDLLARNVQRGRDHGVEPYVNYLQYCLRRLGSIPGITQLNLPTCLKDGAYESILDIDLFPGGIYETPLSGAIVGLTFACIIGEQFYRLKFGDRFFYETTDTQLGFKPDQLAEIQINSSLASIICRNTEVSEIQPHALDARNTETKRRCKHCNNLVQPCDSYADINFQLWKEGRPTEEVLLGES